MASYNRVILMGRLTRNVELKFTPGGLAIAEVGMAVNNRRKNKDGQWIDEACFVDVTMFGRTAEVASEYLSKGAPLFVEGHLKFDSWEKDGQKRNKLSVVCDRLQLLSDKSSARPESKSPSKSDGKAADGFSTTTKESGSAAKTVAEAPVEPDSYVVQGRGEAQPTGDGDGYNDPDIPF